MNKGEGRQNIDRRPKQSKECKRCKKIFLPPKSGNVYCEKCNPLFRNEYLEAWRCKKGKQYANKYYAFSRKELLKKLGAKCARCGFTDWRALQIDHIKGDGNKERMSTSRSKIFRMILDDHGERYQILCANCNWIKRYENNENGKKVII